MINQTIIVSKVTATYKIPATGVFFTGLLIRWIFLQCGPFVGRLGCINVQNEVIYPSTVSKTIPLRIDPPFLHNNGYLISTGRYLSG
jgi:hypothetical protein